MSLELTAGQENEVVNGLIEECAAMDTASLEAQGFATICSVLGCDQDFGREVLEGLMSRNVITVEIDPPGGALQADTPIPRASLVYRRSRG